MKKNPQNVDDLFAAEGVRPVAEIEVGPAKHEQFLDKNYKKITLIVLAAGLVFGGLIVYNGISEDREHSAGAALVASFDKEGQLDLAKLQAIPANYSGTAASVTAGYLEAIALWNQGKDKEGCARMEEFIKNAPSAEFSNQALAVLGCQYMRMGQTEDAIRQFETVIDSQEGIYTPLAYLCLGDMARAKGDFKTAQQYYDNIAQRFPDGAFGTNEFGVSSREDLLDITAPEKVAPPVSPAPAPAGEKDASVPPVSAGSEFSGETK